MTNAILPRLVPLLVLTAFLASACATTASAPQAVPPPARAEQDDLPRVALTPEVLYDVLLGEIAGQRGQLEVAAGVLAKAAAQTRDPRLAERATLAALYGKQYATALRSAELWVELRPHDPEAREAMAVSLLELDRRAEAQRQLEKVLELESARTSLDQGYLRVASVLSRHSNHKVALEVMQALMRQHPEVAAAHVYAAHLAVRSGDLDTADALAQRALELRPEWEEAALFRARVLVSRKDTTGLDSFYRSYLDRHPTATNVRLHYARFLIDQKHWEEAHRQFKRVVAARPEDVDVVYAVGLLSLQTNRLDEAERYLKRTLELRPDHDQARLYLGQVAENRKRYDEAARWYGEIRDGESYFEARARLGVVIARQGDVDSALRHLRSIVPRSTQQQVQRALTKEQILREAKRHSDAFAVLTEALSDVPGDKDLLYARALVAERLDMLDVTERDLREILKKDPKNAHALNALGYTLADRTTRYHEALELIEQALALKPNDPFILDSMGWVQYRLGNYHEAVRYLKQALALRNDAEISAHLGEVLWMMGRRREAESVWNQALRESPDNETLQSVIKKFMQ